MKYLLGLLLSLALYSCAPASVGNYQTGDTHGEVVSLLNERQYPKAIWLLENRTNGDPSGEDAFLLAQAYLGKVGFEPLTFAAKIAEPEPDTENARNLFPQCPKGALDSHFGVPMKCLLKRVYLHAPKADNRDFARARYLLRKAYPDPNTTPAWINTMIGVVETISLVGRAGDVYLFAKGGDPSALLLKGSANLPWLRATGKAAREEGRQAVARAKASGEKISGLLTGSKADVWFAQIDGTVTYSQTVGLPKFLDFVRDNLLKPSDEIRYGEMLDRLRDMVAKQEGTIDGTEAD
jgi:hypothetical protein